jgi:hypothetical protein
MNRKFLSFLRRIGSEMKPVAWQTIQDDKNFNLQDGLYTSRISRISQLRSVRISV